MESEHGQAILGQSVFAGHGEGAQDPWNSLCTGENSLGCVETCQSESSREHCSMSSFANPKEEETDEREARIKKTSVSNRCVESSSRCGGCLAHLVPGRECCAAP